MKIKSFSGGGSPFTGKDFKIDRMNDILGNQAVFDAIVEGEDPRRIAEDWRAPLENFQQLRQRYLLY